MLFDVSSISFSLRSLAAKTIERSATYVFAAGLAVVLAVAGAPQARASMTCFCKLSWQDISGICHPSSAQTFMDLTGAVNLSFSWPRTAGKAQQCATACSNAASAQNLQTMANQACQEGVANGTTLRAFSALGNCGNKGEYGTVQTLGHLVNTPAVTRTVCKCPTGWTCNDCNPQVDGGITADGRCKKLACQPITVTPYPPDGTVVGTQAPPYGTSATSWGFSWGNAFYAWGTRENGGEPKCVTTILSPAVCKIVP